MREFDALVSEYQHDKRKPKEAEALTTLRKVAFFSQTDHASEILESRDPLRILPCTGQLIRPKYQPCEKICLRLRSPHDEKQFIPLEQIVDTMLHELCHIVHGPHNQEFHALWNQLRDEHEQLFRKGYTGEGFLSAGHRLGGKRVPPDELRRQARAAAEKRRVLTAGSGQRLGGMPASRGADMRKVIADAAERRKKVTEGCASGTKEGQKLADEVSHNGFRTKAEEDDANERAIMEAYIELIQQEEREQYGSLYVPPSAANPAGPRALAPPPVPESTKPRLKICTLVNPSMFLCCDACGSERPQVVNPSPPQKPPRPSQKHSFPEERQSAGSNASTKSRRSAVDSLREIDDRMAKRPLGWVCHMCGTFMESEWWTCACCGTIKQSS
ncbi:zinc metallopeptidase [Coccidioides immitis RMSCC 3703]|uniref:Zinc metallopeptidase n=1 Tax=Coccidioides immitis RMSCC 3703 TaxID=454286 RepID=A0A0J8R1C3_COCIT|nr:zinc metallopeptidase [Coccidioides immitis RMSCC 3703]